VDRLNVNGGRVVLREKRIEDAWNEYQWRIDPELSRLDATLPLSISYQEFLRTFKGQFDYPTPWARRLSIETQDGLYIGNCMYYDIDTVNKEAEIGIMIGNRGYWSKSYGFDVLVTLMDYIFSNSSLRRLYLHTLQSNVRAQRCFEKCGFAPKKPVRRSGQDFVLMEVLKDDWEAVREDRLSAREALVKAAS
jgi:RimJ/RimL family protein N-acetyltransferase